MSSSVVLGKKVTLMPVERKDEPFKAKHEWIMQYSPKKSIEIAFLGDSIIRRWEDNVQLFNHFFGEYTCLNMGIGSDTINTVLWRVLEGEFIGMDPKIIVILLGTNSLCELSDEDLIRGLKLLIEIIQAQCPKATILLNGIFPRNPDEVAQDYLQRIRSINKELQVDTLDYCQFLDMEDYFLQGESKVQMSIMPDGLHLSELGYSLWGQQLKKIIESIVGDVNEM